MIRSMLVNWIRSRFAPATPAAVQPPVPPAPVLPAFVPPPPMPAPEVKAPPVRPISAVEILQNEPNLTPAELAQRAGVTLSYARSLVRRRQNRAAAPVVWPIAPRIPVTAQVSASSRTQVIERSAAGAGIPMISEELGVPKGEVEFILKVDRLKKSFKN
jgi:hypothetical protein